MAAETNNMCITVVGEREISLLHSAKIALGSTQPSIQLIPRGCSVGVKRQGREADHSPPSRAECNSSEATPLSLNVFMAWCLINYAKG
jgi:hypothetical protein